MLPTNIDTGAGMKHNNSTNSNLPVRVSFRVISDILKESKYKEVQEEFCKKKQGTVELLEQFKKIENDVQKTGKKNTLEEIEKLKKKEIYKKEISYLLKGIKKLKPSAGKEKNNTFEIPKRLIDEKTISPNEKLLLEKISEMSDLTKKLEDRSKKTKKIITDFLSVTNNKEARGQILSIVKVFNELEKKREDITRELDALTQKTMTSLRKLKLKESVELTLQIPPPHLDNQQEQAEEQTRTKKNIQKALLFAAGIAIDTTGVALGALTHDPYSMYSAFCKLVSNTQSGFSTLIDSKKDVSDQSKMTAETSLQGSVSSGINWIMSRVTPSWSVPFAAAKVIGGAAVGFCANQLMSKVVVPSLLGQPMEHFNFTKENFQTDNKDASKKLLVTAGTLASICGAIAITGTGLLGNKVLSPAALSAGSGNALSAVINVARSAFDKSKTIKDSICSARDLAAGMVVSCIGDVAVGHLFNTLNKHPLIAWPLTMTGTLGLNQASRSILNRFGGACQTSIPEPQSS